jgi:hypothetical protein
MELDPDDVFRDEDEDPENDFFQEKEASKEFVVYLIDASPKMFCSTCPSEEEDKQESHFHIAVSCIAQSLKAHIINRSNDEIAICFFNTVSFWMKRVVLFSFFFGVFTSLFANNFVVTGSVKRRIFRI